MIRLFSGLLLVALLAAACVGCGDAGGEQKYEVSGKITKGGQPLPLDPVLAKARAARVEVRFLRVGEGGQPDYSATGFAEPDGTFKLVDVPKGKYRIAIQHIDGKSSGDTLGGKFDDRNSPVTREITGETKDLNIDLDKPEAA